MIALYLIAFPIMQNVISHYLRMNTNSYTKTHTHKHTCSHTCFSSPWPVYFQNAPNLHTHVTDSYTWTHAQIHTHLAQEETHISLPWLLRSWPSFHGDGDGVGCWLPILGTHPFFTNGGVTRSEVRQKDADRGMTWWHSWRDKYQGMRDNDVKNYGMEGWKRNERALKIGREEVGCKDSWTPWGGIKV